MKKNDLKQIAHITIGDILEITPIMSLPLKDARPVLEEFKTKHNITHEDLKNICRVIMNLDLYK